MFKAENIASKWDWTFNSVANRDTSPTAQVPKLFGPIYATASGRSSSAARPERRLRLGRGAAIGPESCSAPALGG
jgi:hypothetical protein